MRASLHAALALAIFVALAAPAAAAAFDLPEGKPVERALQPGAPAVFTVPVVANQPGEIYAKLLVTEGNAVNDGVRVNGSVETGSGWRITYTAIRADGERIELGSAVDSTPTAGVPVEAGEALTFELRLSVPDDAARGGPSQRVYVAICYRLESPSGPGATSGATMDEARAVTLLLSNALLPPAESAEEEEPTEPAPSENEAPAPTVPSVGGFQQGAAPSTTNVYVEALPAWFLAGTLGLLGAILAVFLLGLAVLVLIWRDLRPAKAEPRGRSVSVPVRAREEPEEEPRAPAPRE